MTTPTETTSERDAYTLLSKPTLELTDDEVEQVVIQLRQKRLAYINEGKKDNGPAKPKAAPKSKAEVDAATAAILAELDI